MSNKLNMTEAQIERQGQKIMDVLFTDIVEETDSGYTAEINHKVTYSSGSRLTNGLTGYVLWLKSPQFMQNFMRSSV